MKPPKKRRKKKENYYAERGIKDLYIEKEFSSLVTEYNFGRSFYV